MAHKIRTICSICDQELAPRNGAPGDVADVRYVDDEKHRGCKAPRQKKLVVVPRKRAAFVPSPSPSTLGSVGALDGTGLVERPAPVV